MGPGYVTILLYCQSCIDYSGTYLLITTWYDCRVRTLCAHYVQCTDSKLLAMYIQYVHSLNWWLSRLAAWGGVSSCPQGYVLYIHTHKHIHTAAYNLPGLQGQPYSCNYNCIILYYLLNFSGAYKNSVVRFVCLVNNAHTTLNNGQGTWSSYSKAGAFSTSRSASICP